MEHCAPYLSSCRRFVLGALCPFPWIAGDAGLHVSAPMPGRVLGRYGTAVRYRGTGLHVDSAMRSLFAWSMRWPASAIRIERMIHLG